MATNGIKVVRGGGCGRGEAEQGKDRRAATRCGDTEVSHRGHVAPPLCERGLGLTSCAPLSRPQSLTWICQKGWHLPDLPHLVVGVVKGEGGAASLGGRRTTVWAGGRGRTWGALPGGLGAAGEVGAERGPRRLEGGLSISPKQGSRGEWDVMDLKGLDALSALLFLATNPRLPGPREGWAEPPSPPTPRFLSRFPAVVCGHRTVWVSPAGRQNLWPNHEASSAPGPGPPGNHDWGPRRRV